jgi:PAS domain S-box-containing protein
MLIDDEEAILRVLSMSLKSDGYEVLTATNGEIGLQIFEQEKPDVVLTDIKMPQMDGLEVLRQIKKCNPDTEVIIITGHGDIESAIEALQCGASDFIQKPVQDEALAVALKRAHEKIDIRHQLKAYTDDLETMVGIATGELERKSSFQAKLIRSANDGIIATDDEWKIVIYNPGAERIFGYKRYEVARKMDVRDLYPTQFVDSLEKNSNQSGEAQKELPWLESMIKSKSGEMIPIRVTGTKLREKKEMMGSVAFFQDLREIKRLERELVNSERLAAIGQTVAGMAHCIKNILHGFKGGSYLVDIGIDRNNQEKLKKGWDMIQRNIVRTSDLVLDLLSYSKQREPDYQLCYPNEIAEDVCELLSTLAANYEVEIVKGFSREVAEAWIDPNTAHRCLMNLVSNAIEACMFDEHFQKQHRVTVRTARRKKDGTIRFEIEDNGSGMSAEVQAKLFQSFFSTKGAKGTGLGLLVTQKLVEEHGGRIFVQSELGQGTTFQIELPQHPVAGKAA